MPDYSYVKRNLEHQQSEEKKKRQKVIDFYYQNEQNLLDDFVRYVKEEIEYHVGRYYQNGKNSCIAKKSLFSSEYVLTIKGEIDYGRSIEADVFYTPKDLSVWRAFIVKGVSSYKLLFPARECMDSFFSKANKILGEEKIEFFLKKVRRGSPNWYVINIKADLGKL